MKNQFKATIMLNTIIKAAENFCIHQIRINPKISDAIPKKRTLIAYIDINTQAGQKYRVYVAVGRSFVQRVAKLFLEENKSDEETLKDMNLEITNLIVGSAKVIAEQEGVNPYMISTPHFLKIDVFDLPCDNAKTLKIKNDTMFIAIKELN